jgi:hypothetical protein
MSQIADSSPRPGCADCGAVSNSGSELPMTAAEFTGLIAEITGQIAVRPLDAALEARLNRDWPTDGAAVRAIRAACDAAIAAGWMCNREHAGIRYGRVVKPGAATHGFSVDVVDMHDVTGGHHRHPTGEIDLVMPVAGDPAFDGHRAGWVVYGPDSAHAPTVAGGRALVLYLLPQGAIEFTRS